MAQYRDFTFNQGVYGKAAEYTDTSAVILAIKNILLTRKGNFPFNPSFGMDIEKYQFDLLDNVTVDNMRSELLSQIATFLPNFQEVVVDVRIIEPDLNLDPEGKPMIGISVTSKVNAQNITSSFLLYRRNGTLSIINETR